jgi:hypothetical protein
MSDTETSGMRRHREGFLLVVEQMGELDMLGFFTGREEAVQRAEMEGAEHRTVFVLPVAYALIQ